MTAKFIVVLDNFWSHLILSVCQKKKYKGFTLYAIEEAEEFFSIVVTALDLIERYDVRRYKRVQKYLPVIAYVKQGVNYYNRALEAAFVDSLPQGEPLLFAGMLVHEATHGVVVKRRISYREHKAREESLCYDEQFRFAKKFVSGQDWPDSQKFEHIKVWSEWIQEAKKHGHDKEKILQGRLMRLEELCGKNWFSRWIIGWLERIGRGRG